MKTAQVTLSILMLCAAIGSGCKHSPNAASTLAPKAGDYDGFYMRKVAEKSSQTFVTGKVAVDKLPTPIAAAFEDGDHHTFSVVARTRDGQTLHVQLPGLLSGELEASWNQAELCFEATDASKVKGHLCANENEITVDFISPEAEIVLIADFRTGEATPPPVKPAAFTLAEAMNVARDQGFDSRIKFEQSEVSRLNALTARLNLLPHFSLGDILGFASLSLTSVLHSVGDMAPFLLPSRWIQAHSKEQQFIADYDAYEIMRADTESTAEGLAYTLIRDKRALALLDTYSKPITDLRDQLHYAEVLGTVIPGTAASVATVVNQLAQMQLELKFSIAIGRTSLSQALGYINPDSVSDIQDQTFDPVATVSLPSDAALESLVLERSLELRQVEALRKVSSDDVKGRFFYWIDPSGSGTGLGAGLPANIKAGIDGEKIVLLQRQQLQSKLLMVLKQTVEELNDSVASYKLSDDNLKIQREHLAQIHFNLTLNRPVSGAEIQNTYQTMLQAEIARGTAQFQFYVSTGKLNRLTYAGPYSDIHWK